MPDASVLVAGGGAPGPQNNTNFEVYYPPYLYDASGELASRPAIDSAPSVIDIGQTFSVDFTSGPGIGRVVMIKTAAVTHSFNMEQRFIELTFTGQRQPVDGAVANPRSRCAAGLLHAVRTRQRGRAVDRPHREGQCRDGAQSSGDASARRSRQPGGPRWRAGVPAAVRLGSERRRPRLRRQRLARGIVVERDHGSDFRAPRRCPVSTTSWWRRATASTTTSRASSGPLPWPGR